jgi:hypothetical protein
MSVLSVKILDSGRAKGLKSFRTLAAALIALPLLSACVTPQKTAGFNPAQTPMASAVVEDLWIVDGTRTGYVPLSKVGQAILDKYQTASVDRAAFNTLVNQCFNSVTPAQVDRFYSSLRMDQRYTNTLTVARNAGLLIQNGGTTACIQQTESGFPVLAAESFVDTVTPEGVTPEVLNQWYRTLAVEITKNGRATAFFSFANGNGVLVNYTLNNRWPELMYATTFKRSGDAKPANTIVFTDAGMKSYRVTSVGGRNARMLFSLNRPRDIHSLPVSPGRPNPTGVPTTAPVDPRRTT